MPTRRTPSEVRDNDSRFVLRSSFVARSRLVHRSFAGRSWFVRPSLAHRCHRFARKGEDHLRSRFLPQTFYGPDMIVPRCIARSHSRTWPSGKSKGSPEGRERAASSTHGIVRRISSIVVHGCPTDGRYFDDRTSRSEIRPPMPQIPRTPVDQGAIPGLLGLPP